MQNLAFIRNHLPNLFTNFPICMPLHTFNEEQKYVCNNYNQFNMIFDAAAIGQYIGGIDPRNTTYDTIGFINETSVINYQHYTIEWVEKKPFLLINKNKVPIFNLHIHSKYLDKYV